MKRTLRAPNPKNSICILILSKKTWLSPSSPSSLKWVRRNEPNSVRSRLVSQWSWRLVSSPFLRAGLPPGVTTFRVPNNWYGSRLPSGLFLQASLLPLEPFRYSSGFSSLFLSVEISVTMCALCFVGLFWLRAYLMSVFPTRVWFPWGERMVSIFCLSYLHRLAPRRSSEDMDSNE